MGGAAVVPRTQLGLSLAGLFGPAQPPGRVVAFGLEGERTLAALRHDVAALVQELQRRECRRWALCFEDSYRLAVAFFAVIAQGGEVVLPGHHRAAVLTELRPNFDAVLTDQALDLGCPVLGVETGAPANGVHVDFTQAATARLLFFTSGSTGEPKAVVKALPQIEAELRVLHSLWGEKLAGTRVVATVSHQHIYGLLFRVLLPLCSGAALARDLFDYPEQVLGAAGPERVLVSSPALLKRLGNGLAPAGYRLIFSSGGLLPFSAARQSAALLGTWPIEVYGSTETGGVAWRRQSEDNTPWQALPGVEVSAVEGGRLQLRSPFLPDGQTYLGDDAIAIEPDGRFRLSGRVDRVLKIEEKRVSLVEVERRLGALAAIDEVAVVPLEGNGRTELGAVVVLAPAGQAQLDASGKAQFVRDVREQLRAWLEPVAIPRRFRFVEQIPVNAQGKLQYRSLQTLFA